ncbi:GNAT family N-acetyltransferase [Streptosporangium sp. NPDC001681]|uniref:GNAT family N-acetyltransferase n=1 Tax=Streptosporangium sp. NPDC001681 TaxID=3154395 RepID=UPI003329F7A0
MDEYGIESVFESDERIDEVIELGNRSRRTIGLLPHSAYFEAARKGCLLAAVKDNKIAAYALFGLPRNEITLTHLVVGQEHRKKGLARTLVRRIAELYPNRSGIRASCREDYKINEMWSSLGFYPRSEKTGRGADRAKVIVWYRNNPDHVDLFTPAFEPLIRASIEFDILRDLHDRPQRPGAQESLILVQDHLLEKLQLITTPQLHREVNSTTDDSRRNKYRWSLSHVYAKAQCDHRQADILTRRLIDRVNEEGAFTSQDHKGARYLGEAAACGADVFVTQDDSLISAFGKAADSVLGIRILRPSDVVIRIDEVSRAEIYRPSDIYGTGYSRAEVMSGTEEELLVFQNVTDGEAKQEFLDTLRSAGMDPRRWSRTLIRDADNRPVLLYASGIVNDQLNVPLLRVDGRHPVSPTLIQHTLFELRRACRAERLEVLFITDRNLPSQVRRAALLDGFVETNEALVALVVDSTGAASEVLEKTRQAGRRAGIEINFDTELEMARFAAAQVERAFWPAKVIDSQLPTFILPIRPEYSSILFGEPAPLPLFRTENWGLGREHVYYRSPYGLRLTAPARIIWYKSQGKERSAAAVIGCSLLEEVVVDDPVKLHSRFSRLGVWDLKHIEGVVRDGKAQALRFTQTEVFDRPLARKRLQDAFAGGSLTGTVQGPRNISPQLFASIYREGTRAG